MKRISVVVGLLFACVVALQAQLIRVEDELFTAKRLANSQKDSVVGFPIEYNGKAFPQLQGRYPDSLRIGYRATNDSTYVVYIRFKARHAGTTAYTSVLLDSIKSTTAAYKTATVLVPGANYGGYQNIGLALVARDTVNAKSSSTASKLRVIFERFFKVP